MKRKPSIPRIPEIKIHKWFAVRAPETPITRALPIELSYLAGLVDGEGNLDIVGTRLRIRVGMKSLEPAKLAKKYGGYWYPRVDKRKGTISYTWYIQTRPLIDDFIKSVMPYSKVKNEEFRLLQKALKIRDAALNGWKDEIRKLREKLRELHHKNPVVIFRAACKFDEKKPGWREWIQPGTLIETKPLECDDVQ